MLLFLLGCPTEPEPTFCEDDQAEATFLVEPYLQWMHDGEVTVMWEADVGTTGSVWHGADASMAKRTQVCAERVPAIPGGDPDDAETQVFQATLDISRASNRQAVEIWSGAARHAFTFEVPEPGDFRFAAASDSQMDTSNPGKWGEIAASILAEGDLAFVLMPGDLVDNGWLVAEWQGDFFAPAAELLQTAPLYPALGNHEAGTLLYTRYFHLPGGLDEHAYGFTRENLRVLTLDSNGWNEGDQLDWLDAELDAACTEPELDFVFAQLHHPWLSEAWTPGESAFTGDVVARLEAFTEACDKPSVHFFGHTHAYSRGQSRDHDHVMVNVASAGGRLDPWGSEDNQDYEAFSVSESDYGFVVVDVTTGDDPSFTLTRVSQGTPETPLDDVVTDTLTVWRFNDAPATPTATCAMSASAFDDPDGHAHQGTHWQVGADCAALDVDIWRQDENRFGGEDLAAGDDLTDEPLPDGAGCVRVRYRDAGLAWSAWSEPVDCSG